MKRLTIKRLSIKTVLISIFAGLALLVAAQGWFAVTSLSKVHGAIDGLYSDQLPSVAAAKDLQAAWDQIRVGESELILAQSDAQRGTAEAFVRTAEVEWDKKFALYNSMMDPVHTDEIKRFAAIGDNHAAAAAKFGELSKRVHAGDFAGATAVLEGDMGKLYADNSGLISTLVTANNQELGDVKEEIDGHYRGTSALTAALALAVLVIAAGAGLFAFFGIGRPLALLAEAIHKLADGDVDVEVPYGHRRDETGEMARATLTFRDSLKARAALEASVREAQIEKEAQQQRLTQIIHDFKAAIIDVVDGVASETALMRDAVGALGRVAEMTRGEADKATHATAGATANITAIASATEEFSASIMEITSQADRTSGRVAETSAIARRADLQVNDLTQAAAQIGNIVEIINSIASQTNLLALNATIEAARAGDAGRGFAVVASEVKALATQTAKATEEIARHVGGIQSASREAALSITQIAAAMEGVTGLAAAIATAVSQQDAVTREITGNISSAAGESQRVAVSVEGVLDAARESNETAARVEGLAGSLSSVSGRLHDTVMRFISQVEQDHVAATARAA